MQLRKLTPQRWRCCSFASILSCNAAGTLGAGWTALLLAGRAAGKESAWVSAAFNAVPACTYPPAQILRPSGYPRPWWN